MAEIQVESYQDGKQDVLTEFLENLKDKNKIKKIRKLVRILQIQGKDLTLPISRFLGDGIHELRDQSCGYRIYYTFFGNVLVAILLVIGDKSSQQSDIERARNRRKNLIAQRKG